MRLVFISRKNIRKQRLTAMGAAKDSLVSDTSEKKFNIRLIAVLLFISHLVGFVGLE